MKLCTTVLALAFTHPFWLGCSGTSLDPKTVVKGDLNPPFNLQSVTSNEEMILQWKITNTEKDIIGYNVYIAEASLSGLKEKLPTDLQSRYDLSTSQIRRCEATKGLFKVFGFSDSDKFAQKSCDDFSPESSASAQGSNTETAAGGTALTPTPAKPNFVRCGGGPGGTIDNGKPNLLSIDLQLASDPEGKPLPTDLKARIGSTLKCKVNKGTPLSDGNTGFVNGKKYVAFVFAVAGDTGNKISYSSNFIEDVPAGYTSIPFTLDAGKFTRIIFPKNPTDGTLLGSVTKEDPNDPKIFLDCPTDQATTDCKINRSMIARTAAGVQKDARVFLFSDIQAGSERLLIAGEKDQVYLVPQTPRSNLYGNSGIFVPGDTALKFDPTTASSSDSNSPGTLSYQSGRNLVAYPGSLFSMVIKDGSGHNHYGKVYLESLSTTASADVPKGTKTFTIWAVVQTALDEVLVEWLNLAKIGGLISRQPSQL